MEKFYKYLDDLNSNMPSPGGGSCCCKTLMLAISVSNKSLNITKMRKRYQNYDKDVQKEFELILNSFYNDLEFLNNSENMDVFLFGEYMKIYKSEDSKQIDSILEKCIFLSFSIFNFAFERLKKLYELEELIVESIKPDLSFGMDLFKSCLKNCKENIDSNIKYLNTCNDKILDLSNKVNKKMEEIL